MSNSNPSRWTPPCSTEWTWGRVLGSGSFGVVFLATCVNPNGLLQQFAVKRALMTNSSSLQKEKRILDKLRDCPEILTCYSGQESDESGDRVYNLVLEYAPAGTLHDLILRYTERSPMPENEVRAYTRMILKGLAYVHEKGFVHCDIKPANILAFPSTDCRNCKYKLKLADFGLSVGPGLEKPSKGKVVYGTLIYSSPESALKKEVGPESDIWSLGCTVLEMMTRREPWATILWPGCTEDNFFELLGKLSPEIPEGVSACGKDFLKKCFERDPKARWTARMLLSHPYISVPAPPVRFLLPHEMIMMMMKMK